MIMNLYHYTCDHGFAGITDNNGLIKPNPYGDGLIWLTDMTVPDRWALGLTSNFTKCDRTRYRFRVDPDQPGIMAWVAWCHDRRIPRKYREPYETSYGARPLHWWVSDQPVIGVLDP